MLPPVALATLPPGQTITATNVNLPGVITTGAVTDSALNISHTTPGSVTGQSTAAVGNGNLSVPVSPQRG